MRKITVFDVMVVLTALIAGLLIAAMLAHSAYQAMGAEVDSYKDLRELRKPISYTDSARGASVWELTRAER